MRGTKELLLRSLVIKSHCAFSEIVQRDMRKNIYVCERLDVVYMMAWLYRAQMN